MTDTKRRKLDLALARTGDRHVREIRHASGLASKIVADTPEDADLLAAKVKRLFLLGATGLPARRLLT